MTIRCGVFDFYLPPLSLEETCADMNSFIRGISIHARDTRVMTGSHHQVLDNLWLFSSKGSHFFERNDLTSVSVQFKSKGL